MKHDLPIVIVDACVLYALFRNESGRVDRAQALLSGHGIVHTVAIPALQEYEFLAPLKFGKGALDERRAHVEKALRFIRDQQFVSLELNQFIARSAGEMYYQVPEKRNDIALLSAAAFHGVEIIYTFDNKLIQAGQGRHFGVKIMEPPQAQGSLFQLP